MESDKIKKEKKINPRAKANPLSALTFCWTLPIFWKGKKRDLEVSDLYEPLNEHTSSVLGDKLERAWVNEINRSKKKNKTPSLLRAILKVFGLDLFLYGLVLCFCEIILRITQPLLLGGLIKYFTPNSDVTKQHAYMYAGGIIICSGFIVLLMHPYLLAVMHVGMKLRVACCSLVYRKALRLSKTALGQTTVGQVVNLLSNDVNRFDVAFIFIHNLWVGPLQTILVTYFLWELVGPASLIGLASLLMFIPFQAWLGRQSSIFRLKTAIKTDERVRLMNEIISGIQVIKMYTWEKPFAKLVALARKNEINKITKSSYIRGVMLSFIIFHTRSSIFFTILAYVLFGNQITAQKVFVLTCFYNTLKQTMTIFFPQGITQIAEASISIKRIQKFLLYEETTLAVKDDIYPSQIENELNGSLKKPENSKPSNELGLGIVLKNASAKWLQSSTDNTLTDINFKVEPGKLTAVIGPVGAGKTSLLHVILKELPLSSGSIDVTGVVSYASQEPWLFAGSVRQNILFGEKYERDRYRQVVKVCALLTDFDQFPYGDKTIVGERGVSLSGGQRARINLARAVYKQADVYILDDPLSAVDTHVGKHLFEDCVTGYLRKKTVILITHQLQYLSSVDQIVLLENGTITAIGTYAELQHTGLDFTKLLAISEEEEAEMARNRVSYSRQSSMQSIASSLGDAAKQIEPTEVEESRTRGSVGGYVYKSYLTAGGGWCLFLSVIGLCILAQALASGGDYWITYWVNLEEYVYTNRTETVKYPFIAPRDVCIYVFSGITAGTIFFTLVRSFLFFFMCMRSSMKLHNRMFSSITRTTMYFFNTNPSGRILNRFSKDMGSIDELLPAALMDVLQIGLVLLAIVIVVASINPWLLIPTFCACVIFYFLRIFYLSTSRSVKRLEGITRSPVFSHLNASLQGLTTIRAFKAQAILETEFDHHQDLHSSAWYLFIASSRAFGFWLDLVCLVYIALVTLSFLVLGGENFGGNVGLAITQSIGLTGMFQWGMRQSAELENQMTSVERVLEYSKLESEPPLESPPDKKPRETWPEEGCVEFSKTHLRYSPDEPWVLKNLNFLVKPQEKVGIVGRTGAGKSSLIAALFRLADIGGQIIVDGVDTLTLGLHELRSKISIIPQEPVLFSGSMRKNLDPFDQHNDEVLWNALEEVELKEVVSEMAGGLQTLVSEGGSNLSVGQRQLVCLARAIVRNNKILILDEATANVDPKTDALIQKTIRRKFANCTVLTIAHRLNTVMDSDKVLVMDAGTMVEFNHPHILLQNEDGVLYQMVAQTGKATAETLHRIAKENYYQFHSGEGESAGAVSIDSGDGTIL